MICLFEGFLSYRFHLEHVKRLLEIANNELPRVEEVYKNLNEEVEKLTLEKQNATETIRELNNDIVHLRNTAEHHRLECEKQASEKRMLYLKKIRLESVIEQLQKSREYTTIVQIVRRQMNNVIGDDKQLLKLAFESIIESLLKDPFRMQSFFEYSMSVASTSTSSSIINDIGCQEGQPSISGQRYLYVDYEGECNEVVRFKDQMLDESDTFHNKKVEEFINKTISEAVI